jgi:hypothetical protein
MTSNERITSLEEQLRDALERICLLEEQLATAQRHIEEREQQKMPSPAFVKANVKWQVSRGTWFRKRRVAQHNHGRRWEPPTRFVEHQITACLVCAVGLAESV